VRAVNARIGDAILSPREALSTLETAYRLEQQGYLAEIGGIAFLLGAFTPGDDEEE
jgi:hypothetical protein